MSREARYVLIDGDSIAYKAGECATEGDMCVWCDNKLRHIIARCESNKLTGWVEAEGGKSNFRRHVATTRPYKGNRNSEKPLLLRQAKEYLVSQYNFRWANWVESEDMVLIAGKKLGFDKCIIAGIDKDLLQVEALFYNYDKDTFTNLSADEAAYNLYTQFITGDSTDNIPGIPGAGPAKAKKVLASDRSQWPRAVALAYIEKGLPYQYMLEQCRLVYLLREMNEVFTFPLSFTEYEQLEKENNDGQG